MINDFFNLIFPKLCCACNNTLLKNEEIVCLNCVINLPKTNFHRIHKSYLVNLNHVVRFNKTVDLYVELNNGEQLPIASRKKESFLNAILHKK